MRTGMMTEMMETCAGGDRRRASDCRYNKEEVAIVRQWERGSGMIAGACKDGLRL